MKIFPSDKVRLIDEYTIRNEPVPSIDLMERAASRLTDWYVKRYRPDRKIFVLAGPGNNGGDALAMARLLIERNYSLQCYLVSNSGKLSEDCRLNLERLKTIKEAEIKLISNAAELPETNASDIIIDGLFGSGMKRQAEGLYREVIEWINRAAAMVISIDIPSGLLGEDNTGNGQSLIVRANITLTFQFPFLSFFFEENEKYTGKWHVLDIGLHEKIIASTETKYEVIERRRVADILPARNKFSHKGTFGHALVIGGSYGMMGAAVLTAEAALRSGTGLVTAHIPGAGYQIMQSALPEAIVSADTDERVFSKVPALDKYNAIAVGPGIGTEDKTVNALKDLLIKVRVPLVIDADALNIIAAHPGILENLNGHTILTPHPGEFDRIAGNSSSGYDRHKKQMEISEKYNLIVILKGAFTGVSFPGGNYLFNTSGNPGMATGGSGDVLTGIILSLLAQGLKPELAAMAAVYLHGVAGDNAAAFYGQESMIAGDIIKCLGGAFKKVKASPFLHEGRPGVGNR